MRRVGQGLATLQPSAQIVGDGAVVAGRVLEDLDRQVEAGGVGDGAALSAISARTRP